MRSSLLLLALGACHTTPTDGADTDVATHLLSTHSPYTAPADPLAGSAVESCDTIDATRCTTGGARQSCKLYNTTTSTWDAAPDALTLRAFHYDRWYDLYQSPDGQTAERGFNGPTPAGTPESVWGDPAHFGWYDGLGDGAIWTGASLDAVMDRYLSTGTEADYARFERKVRAMVTMFEVTGVPGYLARNFFLSVPDGTPITPDHAMRAASQSSGDDIMPIAHPEAVPDLPAAFVDGVPDGHGGTVIGTPMWQGTPSIDQYTGPMVSLPAAWGLVRDPALKDRIATELTCYLKRLQRIEIHHLKDRPDLLEAVSAYFAGGALDGADPDLDLSTIDDVVAFALPQINPLTFDANAGGCPSGLPSTPVRELDATSTSFLGDLLTLAQDMSSRGTATTYDHVYIPSLRGGDAAHMIHLAAMAWLMTGDEQYRSFLEDDLIPHTNAVAIANTIALLRLPPWCQSFYGDHITIAPLWALITLLDDGPLKDEMVRAMNEEAWDKIASHLGNAKFALEEADVAADGDPRKEAARAEAMALLSDFGGTSGVLDDPRRRHEILWDDVAANVDGFAQRCPTAAERHLCEDGVTVLGLTIPGEPISHACTGAAGECVLDDGACADGLASAPLPPEWRIYEDFAWQRNPFRVGEPSLVDGAQQSPGVDLIEPYWMARKIGATDLGAGDVLAWKDDGSCSD